MRHFPGTNSTLNNGRPRRAVWRILLSACLVFLSLLLIAVPFLTSGSEVWVGIDWVDGRKLFSIDDAYRYFVAKNAFELPLTFLWNFTLPVGLLFDAVLAAITNGSLLGMRLVHAGMGILTLLLVARASLRAGCGPVLAILSILIVGLMPIFLVLSSSFYAEGFVTMLLALAFLLLIEERFTPLAIVVSVLPLVRPEGAIYVLLFLGYFGLRRDFLRCAIIAAPGLLYLAAVVSISTDWLSSMNWRLELREILTPLNHGKVLVVTLGQLLNPLWVALALVPLFMRRFRKWWPVLVGPWILIVSQVIAIARGVQDLELRYFFSTIPIFAVAWALPVRAMLDRVAANPPRRRLLASTISAGMLFVLAGHLLQSDWIRKYVDGDAVVNDDRLWFDPKPMRAFAERVDAYVAGHDEIQTVFVANSAPLYFLDFLSTDRRVEPVLIPHNLGVASYSGGYSFGFSLEKLDYQYYKLEPAEDATALLIANVSRGDPFYTLRGESAGLRRPVAANVQSGSFKAYTVKPNVRDSVDWSFPMTETTD